MPHIETMTCRIGTPGMEPHALKARYGKNIVFWGSGMDSQQRAQYPGGVPPENMAAMYEAAYEAGFYA